MDPFPILFHILMYLYYDSDTVRLMTCKNATLMTPHPCHEALRRAVTVGAAAPEIVTGDRKARDSSSLPENMDKYFEEAHDISEKGREKETAIELFFKLQALSSSYSKNMSFKCRHKPIRTCVY